MALSDCSKDRIQARLRILVVDDNEEILQLITDLLAPDYDISTASDGMAMISAAESLKPDLIVADMGLPRLGGIDATCEVLKSRPTSLVIILTMHRDATLVRRALESGARGYVYKQLAGQELVPAINAVLLGNTFISPICKM
jgi:DNA-binding NarL/FixJ family response regulator